MNTLQNVLDYSKLETRLGEWRGAYRSAQPYPHIVIDNFLEPEAAQEAYKTFPPAQSDEWIHYTHVNERKLAQTKREYIPAPALRVIDELNSPRFVQWLVDLSGIPKLVPDPTLQGGGLHQTKRGGFLNIHADFTAHPYQTHWARRLNALVYLNPDWKEEYGGHLQVWDRQAKACQKKVLPIFNRLLIFSTAPDSFHGVPDPLTCPEGWTRKSIALYYFTVEPKPVLTRSTEYRPKPTDSPLRKMMIWGDKQVLRAVDLFKRKLGFSDRALGRILRLFSR